MNEIEQRRRIKQLEAEVLFLKETLALTSKVLEVARAKLIEDRVRLAALEPPPPNPPAEVVPIYIKFRDEPFDD